MSAGCQVFANILCVRPILHAVSGPINSGRLFKTVEVRRDGQFDGVPKDPCLREVIRKCCEYDQDPVPHDPPHWNTVISHTTGSLLQEGQPTGGGVAVLDRRKDAVWYRSSLEGNGEIMVDVPLVIQTSPNTNGRLSPSYYNGELAGEGCRGGSRITIGCCSRRSRPTRKRCDWTLPTRQPNVTWRSRWDGGDRIASRAGRRDGADRRITAGAT